MGRRRVLLVLLSVAAAALALLSVTAALRDTEPPQLYVEADARLPVGAPARLFVSADEPVTFLLEYAGRVYEEVAQEFTFELPAVAGMELARLTATDGAGNATEASALITGIPELEPTFQAPAALRSGDPLGLRLQPSGAGGDPLLRAQVTDVLVTLGEATVPTRRVATADPQAGEALEALVATPLTVDPTTLRLSVTVIDEFGRAAERSQEVTLEPLPVEVEQLQLSAATLAVITPEGREREANAIAAAWARAEAEPLWSEPFRMPIGGVNTSGFGDARRYAQGGPVSFHYGLDLAAPTGTPVHATNAGRVLISGHYPIKGGFIAIDHGGGLMSYYFHLSKLLAAEGQLVAPGDPIGEVGSEGLSTGPHLHWEMRVHQAATNPLAWVDRAFPGAAR